MELKDKGQLSTVDPQEGLSKLENTEDFYGREAESNMEVIGKEFSAEEKERFDSATAKQINTKIIKFNIYPTSVDRFPSMDEVYSVTKEAMDRHIDTMKKQTSVLQEHDIILSTADLYRPNMSSTIEDVQSLIAKLEQANKDTMEEKNLFQSLADTNVRQEAKKIYIEFASMLNNFACFANIRKVFALEMASICRGHAEKLPEFSQKLSEMAEFYEAHAEVFDNVKSIFQKYKDLLTARAESLSKYGF